MSEIKLTDEEIRAIQFVYRQLFNHRELEDAVDTVWELHERIANAEPPGDYTTLERQLSDFAETFVSAKDAISDVCDDVCIFKSEIVLSDDEIRESNDLLSGKTEDRTGDGNTIRVFKTSFSNGWEVDIKLVAGDPTPYVDAVLFDYDGNEVTCLEPAFDEIDGEYYFSTDWGEYRVVVRNDS
jgi:hypothetical protein